MKLLKMLFRQQDVVRRAEVYSRPFPLVASEDDIAACFRLLLNRNPGEKEWHGHRQTAGTPLVEIVSKFLHSNEFKSRKLSSSSLAESGHDIIDTLEGFRICISRDDKVCGSLRDSRDYEAAVTSIVKKVLSPGMSFVDIGANIGYFTLLASRLVGETGKVFAVEPYPYNLKLLNLNLMLNACSNVEVLPFALAEKKGFLNYDDSAGNSGNVFALEANLEAMLESVLVYSVRLDDVLASAKPIDLIKMDIEGAEYLAIQGMKRIIQQDRPIIISELSEGFLQSVSGVTMQDYLKTLLPDESWQLAIIRGVGELEFCGCDIDAVIRCFQEGCSICMDIVAYQAEKHEMLTG